MGEDNSPGLLGRIFGLDSTVQDKEAEKDAGDAPPGKLERQRRRQGMPSG